MRNALNLELSVRALEVDRMTSRVIYHFLSYDEDRQRIDFAVRRQRNMPSGGGKGFVGMNPMVEEKGWGRRLTRCEPSIGLQGQCFPCVEKP